MNRLTDLNSLPLGELFEELTRPGLVRRVLEIARDEDLGAPGAARDATTQAWASADRTVEGAVVARAPGVVAGLRVVPMLVDVFGFKCEVRPLVQDGQAVPPRTAIARVRGMAREVLAMERTLLNLVGRLSGVASLTARFVAAMEPRSAGSRARLFDTRKTTPGLRTLEKYSVRCGGGFCHRLGLYDAVLIKDNHLAGTPIGEMGAAVIEASRRARAAGPVRFVEVEADRLEQLGVLLGLPRGTVDVILLDNMSSPDLRRAVQLRDDARSPVELEASGGVSVNTIRAIAETGVDRISAGAITHSAAALDVALDVE